MYKLYTFEDHATGTVEASNNPQFNDTKVFPLNTDPFLHRYISLLLLDDFCVNKLLNYL